jgi:hypothetical protein
LGIVQCHVGVVFLGESLVLHRAGEASSGSDQTTVGRRIAPGYGELIEDSSEVIQSGAGQREVVCEGVRAEVGGESRQRIRIDGELRPLKNVEKPALKLAASNEH